MVVNLKNFLIKIIFYSCMFTIIAGMLRVSGTIPALGNIYYIFKYFCSFASLLYFILMLKIDNNKFIGLTFFLITYILLVTIFTSSFHFPRGFFDIILWPILIVIFYDYTKYRGDYPFIKKSILFFYIAVIFSCIYLIRIRAGGITGSGTVVFNTYFCLTMLPLVLKFQSDKRGKFLAVTSILVLLFTAKRTGILIAIIGCVAYYISATKISGSSRQRLKKYIKYILILALVMTLAYILWREQIDKVLLRFNSLSEDEGSGRLDIWKYIIYLFNNSNSLQKLFGHGTHSILYNVKPNGLDIFAHNSFLEYLYDYGVIGISLLIIYVLAIVKKLFSYMKKKTNDLPILVYTVVVMIFLSMFSYFFEQSYIILPISIVLGIIFGEEKKENLNES